jgi:hypothetical protein
MSLFKKEKKKEKSHVEIERDCLKVTLEHVIRENNELKLRVEDLKMTAKSNKDLLKEYIDNITDKDKTVQKMNHTIDLLRERLANLNEHLKKHNIELEKEKILKSELTQKITNNKISKQNTSINSINVTTKPKREESKNRSDKTTNAKTENCETTLKENTDASIFNRSLNLNLNLSSAYNLKPKQQTYSNNLQSNTPTNNQNKTQNKTKSTYLNNNSLNIPFSNASIASLICQKCKIIQDQFSNKLKDVFLIIIVKNSLKS